MRAQRGVLLEGQALRRRITGLIEGFARLPRGVRVLQVVTGGLVALYLGSTILRPPGTSIAFFDVWVNNLGIVGCVTLLVWRAIAQRRGRWVWAAFAGGLTFFTAGSVLYTALVQHFSTVPYPSIADFSFLADYPLALLGMILLV